MLRGWFNAPRTSRSLSLRLPRSKIFRHSSTRTPPKSGSHTYISRLYSSIAKLSTGQILTGALTLGVFVHIGGTYFFAFSGTYGISMLPTINSIGDAVLISKWYRRGRGVKVGDVVSFLHPVESEVQSIKRVIGIGGDFVLRDTPGKSAIMIQVPQGHCWVVGDNLTHSRDSRMFGPLPMALIKGKVIMRFAGGYRPQWMPNGLLPPADEDDVE